MGSIVHFDLPLDAFQRALAREALVAGGAPFDPADPERFRAGARRVWEIYQDARRSRRPPLAAWPSHEIDRRVYERDRGEHIDDPSLPAERRTQLIESLDRVNAVVGAYRWLFHALKLHLRSAPSGEVSVLDIGSGHGRLPIRLALKGQLGAHRLRVIGSDIEPAYVAAARIAAAEAGADVEFRVIDALALDRLPAEDRFDVITCTQTVHHFPPDFLAELLARARARARHGVLLFDARRSMLTLGGVYLATYALSAGDTMFLHDGVVSIRRMYSPAELELLARCAPGGEAFAAQNFGPQYVVMRAFARS
jgi:SAM-dependent methyltransferase